MRLPEKINELLERSDEVPLGVSVGAFAVGVLIDSDAAIDMLTDDLPVLLGTGRLLAGTALVVPSAAMLWRRGKDWWAEQMRIDLEYDLERLAAKAHRKSSE